MIGSVSPEQRFIFCGMTSKDSHYCHSLGPDEKRHGFRQSSRRLATPVPGNQDMIEGVWQRLVGRHEHNVTARAEQDLLDHFLGVLKAAIRAKSNEGVGNACL